MKRTRCRDGIRKSGWPGRSRTLRSILRCLPRICLRRKKSASSGLVPSLRMRDIISLRFFAEKMSATLAFQKFEFGLNRVLIDPRRGQVGRCGEGERDLIDCCRKLSR